MGKFNGDLYLGGESAGGNLAAVLTSLNYDDDFKTLSGEKIKGLVLVYPCVDNDFSRNSWVVHKDAFLSALQMKNYWDLYQITNYDDFRVFPIKTPDHILKLYPPTLLILADHDVLLDEGLDFSNKIPGSQTTVYNRTIHGFFGRPLFSDGFNALYQVASFFKSLNKQ